MATSRTTKQLRKEYALQKLGGVCVQCGSTESLEFDHIDPSTKTFVITHWLDIEIRRFDHELSKCQLLCKKCHRIKTQGGRIVEHGGGVKGKHDCSCELCVAKRKEYDSRRYLKRISPEKGR